MKSSHTKSYEYHFAWRVRPRDSRTKERAALPSNKVEPRIIFVLMSYVLVRTFILLAKEITIMSVTIKLPDGSEKKFDQAVSCMQVAERDRKSTRLNSSHM